MKKLFLTMLSAAVIFGAAANADYTAVQNENGIKIEDVKSDMLVLNGYKDGVLSYSGLFSAKDGKVDVPSEIADFDEIRAWDTKDSIQKVTITKASPAPAPTSSPSPTATPAPTADPSASRYPAVYGSEANAIYSPSLVEDIQATVKDGENGYTVKYFFTGEEKSIFIPDTVTVTAACDAYSDVIGKDVSAIEKGDTVYIDRKMDGSVRTVALICRAPEKSLFLNGSDYGEDMEKYFSQNGRVANAASWKVVGYKSGVLKEQYQYAFGLVGQRDEQLLYLMNESGSIDNALRITLSEDTIVYSHDASARGEQEIGKISAITSNISRSDWNNGSTVKYDADNTGSYALVRLVDGKATDIVYYCGY